MPEFEGYTHETTVNVSEACDTIYSPDGSINQELDDRGVERADTTDALCVVVGIGTAIAGTKVGPVGSAGGFIIGKLGCQAGVYSCVVEDFATGLSGCGDLELEIHVREVIETDATGEPLSNQGPVLVAPKCSDLSLADVIDAIESMGGDILEQGDSLIDNITDTGGDVVDDFTDTGEDIVDQGANFIGL